MICEKNCYVVHDGNKKQIRIGNERIERVFQYDLKKERFFTSQFRNKTTGQNWSVSESREFRISIKRGEHTIGIGNYYEEPEGSLKFEDLTIEELKDGGKKLKITIKSTRAPVRVHLYQEIHPECDWTRRWIGVENNGTEPLIVTEYDPEIIGIPSGLKGFYFNSWRWGSRSFVKDNLSYAGTGVHSISIRGRVVKPPTIPTDSPLVVGEENGDKKEFLWFFPEVPIKSVVIRDDPHPQLYTMNPWGENVPSEKTINFSAGVVVGIGTGKYYEGFKSFRSYLEKWVVKGNMDYTKAMLVYNTWYGLGSSDTEPNEKSCLKQIDTCAELGLDMYVLDAGWHTHFGDWDVDKSKFPDGLKMISDYCHKRGLKFGLWIDCRSACKCSRVYKSHPEWGHKRPDGTLYDDRFSEHGLVAMCLSSGYGEHLKKRFVKIAKDLKLDCLKVDNVCLLSYHDYWTECYAADHHHMPGASHKSTWDKWVEIIDAVKAARPEIIIESIPSGLSLLDKHHIVWMSDYQYRPDWMKEAYYCRALNYHMAYTHPPATIHQGWASTECTDLHTLDYLCASTLGSNVQCGVTGRIELATEVQKAVLKKWINWHKSNKKYLGVYQHLFEDIPPIPLELITDDGLMHSLAHHWRPSYIDGFAHLLNDGGWIFLFNPTNETKSVSFMLSLSDYGIYKFSAVSDFASFDYFPDGNILKLNQTLLPGTYSQSWIQVGYPICIKKIETKIVDVNWNKENKEFTLSTIGKDGKYNVLLTTGGLGRPTAYENCVVTGYEQSTDTLTITYHLVGGMADGSQDLIRLRWDA